MLQILKINDFYFLFTLVSTENLFLTKVTQDEIWTFRGGAPILRRAVRPILGHYGYF